MKIFTTLFLALSLTACASSVVPVLETPGPVTEVRKHTATTPEGTTSTEESVELSAAMAEMRLKLAVLETQVARAKARATNPCASWFMAPSGCYNHGGGYVITGSGPGGRNIQWNGGGVRFTQPTVTTLPPTGKTEGGKNSNW